MKAAAFVSPLRLAFALLLLPLNALATIPAPPKYVFAHYMICCPKDGTGATSQQLQEEILSAYSYSVDGFALNIGGWSAEPVYQLVTEQMFKAAADAKVPFKLFFSIDQLSVEDAVSAITMYANHPNYLHVDRNPVVSTYAGDTEWGKQIREKLRLLGLKIYFIPYYHYPHRDRAVLLQPSSRSRHIITKVLNDNPDLDGYFLFGAGDRQEKLVSAIEVTGSELRSRNKAFMVGVAPFYKGYGKNSRVFESYGFGGMQAQWRAAIDAQADWVQLVTWNDWGESTYVSPFYNHPVRALWQGHWGPLLAHDAFIKASQYYINWFKNGKPPNLTSNNIYYFYRPHLKDAHGTVDFRDGAVGRPAGWEELKDSFFISSFLTEPITLRVQIGSSTYDVHLPAGVGSSELPLEAGGIRVNVKGSEGTEVPILLPFAVADNKADGNFNYYAGELYLP